MLHTTSWPLLPPARHRPGADPPRGRHGGSRARRAPGGPGVLAALAGLAIAIALAGCAAPAASPSFDPDARCIVDSRLEGAYPELEALIPSEVDGRPPVRLDSGRNCTEENLATLWDRGFGEVQFAGGLWERGDRSGTTLAIFRSAGLSPELIAEWYEVAAQLTGDAETPEVTERTVNGRPGIRIDSLVDEATFTTVLVWGAPDDADTVQVALIGTDVRAESREAHEAALVEAIEAFEASEPG
jgi:hypothetical protein